MGDPPFFRATGVELDRRSSTGTPRWVKVFGIVVLVLVVLFAVLQLTGVAGRHGPGRHAPLAGVTEDQTRAGGHTGGDAPGGGVREQLPP